MEPTTSASKSRWASRFFTIWTGQAVSLLGSQLVSFALIWWLTRTTGSANVLATATLAGMLPQVLLGPVAGAIVDRWNRRRIMIVADSLIALATLLLAILYLTGRVEIWHVYGLMFIRSLCGGFHWAAMQASTSLLVPKEHLSRIQGLNQMLQGGMNIVAAPLGALLLELLPVEGVLAIDVVTALLAVLPLLFFTIPQPVRKEAAARDGQLLALWQDLKAGWKYAWSWPGLVMVGLAATVINMLLTPASSLMPLLVTEHFKGEAIHLAGLQSAQGVGIILGGLLLGIWGGFKRRIYTSMIGVTLIGLGMMAISFVPSSLIGLAVVFSFVVGFSLPIANGPFMAIVQAAVDPEMQGRVFTLMSSVAMAMSPLGLIMAGPLAEAFGVQVFYLAGGLAAALLSAAMFFLPAVRNIEDGHPRAHPKEALLEAVPEAAQD